MPSLGPFGLSVLQEVKMRKVNNEWKRKLDNKWLMDSGQQMTDGQWTPNDTKSSVGLWPGDLKVDVLGH